MTNKQKMFSTVMWVVGTIIILIVAGVSARAHTPPCTIQYEGVAVDPTCRMVQVPSSDGKSVVDIYVCE